MKGDRYIDVHADDENAFIFSCEYGHLPVVKLLLSLVDDRYINVHANNERAFIATCYGNHVKIIKLLLSLKNDRKINLSAVFTSNFDDQYRILILRLLLNKIYKSRKYLLMKRNTGKNKRLTLRELKSLPKSHLYTNFPGGSDYLKMLSKY